MSFGDSLQIGSYKLVCQSYSQDSNPNYDTDYALLDVFHNGKKITQLAPERRFYNASQQPSTIVAIHSTLAHDLYVVFEGRNPETDKPIIKVFLNPLVNWIWIGVGIVIFGTGIALVPPLKPATRRVEETAAQKLSFRSEAEESALLPLGVRKLPMHKRLLHIALICVLAVPMLGAGAPSSRFDAIGHKLMCVCGCGQILLECNHVGCPDSDREITELRTEIATGLPDSGVFNWFVAKYGPTVLAAPIRGGFDNVAWIVPFAALLLGIGIVDLSHAPLAPSHPARRPSNRPAIRRRHASRPHPPGDYLLSHPASTTR